MKTLIRFITITAMLLPSLTWAEKLMPCEYVKEKLIKNLSYYSKKHTPQFLDCVSNYRVCAVADDQVVSATLIKHIPDKYESTNIVIVQSPKNDAFPVCLIGTYSGGSAAAWAFDAYKITNNKAVQFPGMYRAYAAGDAVPPKSAAKVTYEMFDKYAEKLNDFTNKANIKAFDISKFKNTNKLIWNSEFKEYISDYFGDLKEFYFFKNATVAKQIQEGLGGPPEKIKEIENNIYIASACRFRSCPEKAAIIVDLKNNHVSFGLIGYMCTNDNTVEYCKDGQLVIFYKNKEAKDALSHYLIEWKDMHAPKAKVIFKLVTSDRAFYVDAPPEHIISQYIENWSFPEKGDIVKRENLFFKKVDANGDGTLDWYLDDPSRCGSQGCNGSVYLYKNSKYCFGGNEMRHTVGTLPNKELKCIK